MRSRFIAHEQAPSIDVPNLVTPIVGAVKALATVGEIADVMRKRFGEYHPAR